MLGFHQPALALADLLALYAIQVYKGLVTERGDLKEALAAAGTAAAEQQTKQQQQQQQQQPS
jgi:hypothetical protein